VVYKFHVGSISKEKGGYHFVNAAMWERYMMQPNYHKHSWKRMQVQTTNRFNEGEGKRGNSF
jgi:hypothetical protein